MMLTGDIDEIFRRTTARGAEEMNKGTPKKHPRDLPLVLRYYSYNKTTGVFTLKREYKHGTLTEAEIAELST